MGKADATISGGVNGIAACIDATHEVIAQSVGGGVVGVAGAAVSGDAQAVGGGGVDSSAAGVDANHKVIAEAVAGGFVGEGERFSARASGLDPDPIEIQFAEQLPQYGPLVVLAGGAGQ